MQLLQLEDILNLPQNVCEKPCVYFLLNENKIVYIGKSVNISHRIRKHYYSDKIYTDFRCLFFDNADEIVNYETAYIKEFLPIYNKAYNALRTKKPVTIRVSDEVEDIIRKIALKWQSTQARVIEEAIRSMAKKEKIKVGE